MKRAYEHLDKLGLEPVDQHKTKPYDSQCKAEGTQGNGRSISLTPNEMRHAKEHKNSALFIVHSVVVKGKRAPRVSGGEDLFVRPWDISAGKLEPRGYVFTLPDRQ